MLKKLAGPNPNYLSKLVLDNSIDVMFLQETRADYEEGLRKRGHCMLLQFNATYHHCYDIATYLSNDIEHAHLPSTSIENNIHVVGIKVDNIRLISVYKPPNQVWPSTVLQVYEHKTIYAGYFNSHNEMRRENYSKDLDKCIWFIPTIVLKKP